MSSHELGAATTFGQAKEFQDLARLCEVAAAADRELDARIACAVFPGLAHLARLDIAVWSHDDGSRIRALRYTGEPAAAAMLVPPGHWIEADHDWHDCVWLYGPGSDDALSARHAHRPLAISAVCLRMRACLATISRRI